MVKGMSVGRVYLPQSRLMHPVLALLTSSTPLRAVIPLARICGPSSTFCTTVNDASMKCWNCGSTISKCSMFCSYASCKIIQSVDPSNCNYFDVLRFPVAYNIDNVKLEESFKLLQQQLHPDKYCLKSDREKLASSNNSSLVNQAYQVDVNIFTLAYNSYLTW